MDIFNVLNLIGGLCLFLFGMSIMGEALERRAGGKLKNILEKFTSNKIAGFLTGLGVTGIIQSSSATTVMVVGFVNSRIMTLKQAINVIMGANVGTTVTAWILSLSGISGNNMFLKLLKPSSFTPVLALLGIILYMFCKSDKKKDNGTVLLGFATLMFGMETMSKAVSGLSSIPEFQQLFLMFKNPLLGVMAGAVLTAIIQSSSASVGILQALASTGQVSYGAAIPIIMGQNIGTCVTAIISSIGANKNAKRTAMVHLLFNIIGTVFWITVFCIIKWVLSPIFFNHSASLFGIAVAHSIFNILCTILLMPMSGLLEKIVCKLVPADEKDSQYQEIMLDERLLLTPQIALQRSELLAHQMASYAVEAMNYSMSMLNSYDPEKAKRIRENEEKTDRYEDVLGTYLVKLSTYKVSNEEGYEIVKLLKLIGDFERIGDHSINILESAEEINEKGIEFSQDAKKELKYILSAVDEILNLSYMSFINGDVQTAFDVEPLEQVIDKLKETLRTNHILRLQKGECSIETGFVWSDLLTDLERTSDHCSNIAGCIIDAANEDFDTHKMTNEMKSDSSFKEKYKKYIEKYDINRYN